MIKIREAKHHKLSGVSSLFISSSKYIPELQYLINSFGTYVYDKSSKEWELPVKALSYILDNFVYFDDIELTVEDIVDETQNVKLKVVPRVEPFKHQTEAVKYGLLHDKWLLLDDPGLGKSLSLIMLAEELKEQKGIEHCIVICGINTLKSNWEKEIKKFSHLDSVIIGKKVSKKGRVSYASIKERAKQLHDKINEFFIIINVEMLRSEEIVEAINTSENSFGMMVFDECHKACGTGSKQSDNLVKLSAEHMVASTGTLIMNNPLDSYIPLAWIGKERKRNLTNFKKTYCIFDTFTRGRIVGFKNLEMLQEEIEECSLRRTKDCLDLPEKTVIDELVDLDDTCQHFYESVENGVKEECDKIELKKNNVLALVTRLRQATSCPQALTSKEIISSKIQRAVELVNQIVSQGDKVVIMSVFQPPVEQLAELLKQHKPLLGYGDMTAESVFANMEKFQNEDENKVFICTAQKCGTGFTLTRARYMIMLDLPWTSALTRQCEDRIHRIGAKQPIFVYHLICKGTIDEQVSNIVKMKQAISEYIVDEQLTDETADILRKYIQDL